MSKIGIFFGSSSGTTEEIASKIASRLGVATGDVHNVADADAAELANYDVLLLGSSTWGMGDLQDDWESFLPNAKEQNLAGKKVALFGCGDSSSYSDTFCDALATIKEELSSTGCSFIGTIPAEGYNFDESRCQEGDQLIGVLLDEVNESGESDERIDIWVDAVKKAI